jgi:hypothetical protein
MSQRHGLVGKIVSLSTPQLVVGSDAFVVSQVRYHGSGEPYAFSGLTGATAYFPGATGAVTSVGSVEAADQGLVRFSIPKAVSAGLLPGDDQAWYQTFVDARGTTTVLYDSLDIVAVPF